MKVVMARRAHACRARTAFRCCVWRRGRRGGDRRIPGRAEFALRHGAGGRDLYVANTMPWCACVHTGATRSLHRNQGGRSPGRGLNHHWTRTSSRVSTAPALRDVAPTATWRKRIDQEEGAPHLELISDGVQRISHGPAQPERMLEPESGALWTSVNERDELGSDLVPDYMTSVRDAVSTAGRTAIRAACRTRVDRRDRTCCSAISPTTRWGRTRPRWASPRHRATLPRIRRGMFVGQPLGNRKPHSGYKVISCIQRGRRQRSVVDVLTGSSRRMHALGRPVGVALDKTVPAGRR